MEVNRASQMLIEGASPFTRRKFGLASHQKSETQMPLKSDRCEFRQNGSLNSEILLDIDICLGIGAFSVLSRI